MRARLFQWLCLALALWLVSGCARPPPGPLTAEADEPAFLRGRELMRQGRNQEALAAFLKVIEQRGDQAPESHLDVGVLFQQHIKDPIAAIYHYRKYLELKPNAPQADLVRQRIGASMREFARTLPAQPLENQAMRNDMFEVVERLQRENLELKNQLALARANAAAPLPGTRPSVADLELRNPAAVPPASGPAAIIEPVMTAPAAAASSHPISRAPLPDEPRTLQPPMRPADAAAAPAQGVTLPSGARRHIVVKGDTLMSVALRYYNNRSRYRDIYAANRHQMSNENDLKLGMELIIP
ncbi:MAG TPA: LysM peptidoglycan-binding domain-containing protein [Candidatus Synoicihabitans sp.]|nr:LysM peptidoglycan-binding domain-containing protein [Candidatus Synoicihabitans sp.]